MRFWIGTDTSIQYLNSVILPKCTLIRLESLEKPARYASCQVHCCLMRVEGVRFEGAMVEGDVEGGMGLFLKVR